MDEEQWLRRLLEASRLALERAREGRNADRELAEGLEAFRVQLAQRLRELTRR